MQEYSAAGVIGNAVLSMVLLRLYADACAKKFTAVLLLFTLWELAFALSCLFYLRSRLVASLR